MMTITFDAKKYENMRLEMQGKLYFTNCGIEMTPEQREKIVELANRLIKLKKPNKPVKRRSTKKLILKEIKEMTDLSRSYYRTMDERYKERIKRTKP